jgi:hypothetical protein
MRTLWILGLLAATASAAAVQGDRITVEGVTHEGVLVRESASRYYVQVPADGSVFSVAKDQVAPGAVQMETDRAIRDEMLSRWEAARPAEPAIRPRNTEVRQSSDSEPGPVLITNVGRERPKYASADGVTPSVRMHNVPLRYALNALLRPHGLSYAVQDNMLWVSSPARLRHEATGPLQTRAYNLNSVTASQTMPRVVMSNQGGFGGPIGGFGGGNNRSAGFQSGGGFSGGGFGGGNNRGGGGFGGGGFGGGNNGGGGFGGGNNRGGGGGAFFFSNISELFANIDDRTVGETPAIIGAQPIVATRRYRY